MATTQAAHWVLLPRERQPEAKTKEPLFYQRILQNITFEIPKCCSININIAEQTLENGVTLKAVLLLTGQSSIG